MLNSAQRIILAGLILLAGSMAFDLADAGELEDTLVGKTYKSEFLICNTPELAEQYVRSIVEDGLSRDEAQDSIGMDDKGRWECGIGTWVYIFNGIEYSLPDLDIGYNINKITVIGGVVNAAGDVKHFPDYVQYSFSIMEEEDKKK